MRKCRKYHAFVAFFQLNLRVDFQVVVLKAATTRGFCMFDFRKVKQQVSSNDHPTTADQVKHKNKNKSHSHGRHHPPHHCTAPPNSTTRSRKQKEKTSRIRMDSPPPPPLHRTTKQHNKIKKTKRKNKSHSHGRHHPPHHCTAPPNSTRSRKITPHRLERQMQVEAGMCRKSRDGQNTAKTDGDATDTGKHRKKRCERKR